MNNFDIKVYSYDDVHIKLDVPEQGIAFELRDFFTFTVPGARFTPAFKKKLWNGKIHLFNPYNSLLYAGLIYYLIKFCEDAGYKLAFDTSFVLPKEDHFTKKQTLDFIETLNIHSKGTKLTPMPHQVEGVMHSINRKRALLLSPTASGKSFILYCLIRYFQQQTDKKLLLVVPTVGLVYQMFNDFKDYSSEDSWNVDENCHLLFQGKSKDSEKQIIISTWQSIYKLSKSYFDQFTAVFVDECHLASAASLKGILEKLTHCPVRIGTTGTLDGSKANLLVLEGLAGKVKRLANTKDLMDSGHLSNLKISCISLGYSEEERRAAKDLKYDEEIEFLIGNSKRNEFLVNLSLATKGNTLILFRFVEKHGKVLYDMTVEKLKNTNRKVFFIHGATEAEYREEIRSITEKEENAILIASVGVFSTGINIKRLHNIIFASPSKGRVRVLQSIGRQLRLAKNKVVARLYDIGDDLAYKSHVNYSLKHLAERIKIYNEEQFEYTIAKVKL